MRPHPDDDPYQDDPLQDERDAQREALIDYHPDDDLPTADGPLETDAQRAARERARADEVRATRQAAAQRLSVAVDDVPADEYQAQAQWRTWARWTRQMPLRHLLTLPPELAPSKRDAWCVGGQVGGPPPYDVAHVRGDGTVAIGVLTDVARILPLLADYLDVSVEQLEALVAHPVPPAWRSWAGLTRPDR